MRKRITSLLLTLVMLLSLVPAMGVTASAAEPEWTTVYSYAELQTAVKDKKEYIKLGQDIDTTNFHSTGSGLEVEDWLTFENQTCTLDLNGKTLTLMTRLLTMGVFLRVYDGSNLTITDSSSAKTGAITGTFKNYIASDAGCCLFHVIRGSSLTLENGSITVTSEPHESNADAVRAMDSNITIKEGVTISHPGKFYPEHSYIDLDGNSYALRTDGKCKVIIDGGVFDGHVKLSGYQDTNGSIQINKGTFKKDVQVLYTAEENNSNPAVTVNGGTFEGNVYLQYWPWKTSLYMPYRLNGGTFKGTVNLHTDSDIYEKDKPTGNPNIALGLNECFGYSAVVTPDGTFAGPNAYTAVILEKLDHFTNKCYKMLLQGTASNPVTVIPNAWGMKSVTLDGDPIDYFKDWKGTVERMDNSTAHTLKFEWYPLAQKLKDAGYSYRANFDCYTVGSNTPTTSDPISATATEYRHTIPAGKAPSVYPFDLQLNLDKNGSSVGIMVNQHIVKLVVNPAPVVTEISSAPVRLSAALTPGTSAPSATAVGSGYTVDSINWYTNNSCTDLAPSTLVAGTEYYGKIVLKPKTNYKFAASASAVPFCDDPNENYSIVGSSTVAEGGSSLTLIVKGTAVSALVWDTVNTNTDDKTYTIGDSALTLNAKATGDDSSKPISYKLIAKKDGTETVKASAMVAASLTDSFSAPLSFTDTGSYECWFEATRGNVTITSDHFTVTVNAPGLSITNQSGDLTVGQNGTARLFVKAVGHGVNYQWQVKDGDAWNAIPSETAYDYAAPTTNVGAKTYRCKVTDKYGAFEYTNEMTVTVTEGADTSLTPAIPLAAVNGDAPDPAKLWPDKKVPPNIWLSRTAQYNVTAGDTFNGVATFSTIPTGFNMNGHDIYSIEGVQKTPVLGDISYEWKAAATEPWLAAGGAIAVLSTEKSANITIPSGVTTYYAQLKVMNTVGTDTQTSTVEITFHVSPAHVHTYAYAQLDATNHTKYCTAGDYSDTEAHTKDSNGICTLCGYAPAKTYSVSVTNGTATPDANVAPGTQVTLTAAHAPSGQEFDKWVGNVTVASDNTFNMPSHDVTVAATYKPTAHTHNYSAWAKLDDNYHYQTCSVPGCDEPTKVEEHTFGNWTKVDDQNHTGTCTDCHYVKTENHSWVFDHEDAPTFAAAGTRYYKCSATGCTATKTESIPKLIEYTVTVKDDGNGKASTSHAQAVAGTEITLTVTANSGYHFKEWQVVKGGMTITNNKFTMPAENVEVKAIFEKNTSTGGGGGGGVTTYAITVKSAKNGDVTASHKTASKGTAVTLTVDPDKGYVLDTLTVLDGNNKDLKLTEKNGKFTFTMPASKVTVAATFKASAPTGKNPFIDVPAGSYYEDAVVWAVEKGITSGTSAVTFDPNGNCTRAQAVTFLWRAAGSPAPKTKVMPFTDVPSGSYYYDAVLWAMEQGITKGTSDTAFSPNASCTRAQIVTFLWRANGSPAVSGNSAFTDVASDAYYAAAVAWAEKNGVTGGIGNGLFGSGNNCTRAQIVTFLYRAMK